VKKLKKGGPLRSGTLRAHIRRVRGGAYDPWGAVTLRFSGDDGGFLVKLNVNGLEPDCMDCGLAIYSGQRCRWPDSPLFHGGDDMNPWPMKFTTNSTGGSNFGMVVSNGLLGAGNRDRTIVMYDSNQNMMACGELSTASRWAGRTLTAELGMYPNYDGDLRVSGMVSVDFFRYGDIMFSFAVEGLEPNCEKCGIHIHAGVTCDMFDEVLGHYWDKEELGDDDPWVAAQGAYYISNAQGMASRSFPLYFGYGFEDNVGHAVVVHASDGTRIACGILEVPTY